MHLLSTISIVLLASTALAGNLVPSKSDWKIHDHKFVRLPRKAAVTSGYCQKIHNTRLHVPMAKPFRLGPDYYICYNSKARDWDGKDPSLLSDEQLQASLTYQPHNDDKNDLESKPGAKIHRDVDEFDLYERDLDDDLAAREPDEYYDIFE